MDDEGFGNCTNHGECEAVCPKNITLDFIARMNRDYLKASLMGAEESRGRRLTPRVLPVERSTRGISRAPVKARPLPFAPVSLRALS